MTRDEWNDVLATEPATRNQVGALHREFAKRGLHSRYDRAERLAISAAMLELDSLGTFGDLTMGEAGRLLAMLLAAAPDRPSAGTGEPLATERGRQAAPWAGNAHDRSERGRGCLTMAAVFRAMTKTAWPT